MPLRAEVTAAQVRAARSGDARAFAAVYRAFQPVLLRYLRVLAGTEAEDVASEAWLQVTRDLGRFRGDGDDLLGWVLTIGRNRALDHFRAASRRPSDPSDPAELPERTAGDETYAATEEALGTRRALDLIARLPREQAEAVFLRVVVGLDGPAAARVLGRRPGAVRMATSRGLATLEAMVGDTFPARGAHQV